MNFQSWKQNYEATSFVYGVADCCLALADWAKANGYPDGATDLRGTYNNENDMYSIIQTYGDVVGIVEHCASIAGVAQASRQQIGSIAVIGNPSNMYRQWGAIWDGVRWQVFLKGGFTGLTAKPLKIWAV